MPKILNGKTSNRKDYPSRFKLFKMYKEGNITGTQLAKELGITRARVYQLLEEYGMLRDK